MYENGFVVHKGWIYCFKRMMRRQNTLNCAVQYLTYDMAEQILYYSNEDPKVISCILLEKLPNDIQELYQSYLAEKELLDL